MLAQRQRPLTKTIYPPNHPVAKVEELSISYAVHSANDTESIVPLARIALENLKHAVAQPPPEEERHVRQPDSWLLRRCWQVLADAGEGSAALRIVPLIEWRYPQARYETLHRLATGGAGDPKVRPLVLRQLRELRPVLFATNVQDVEAHAERLLWTASAAAQIGEEPFAFACLERLDQFPDVWNTLFPQPKLLELLAESIAWTGLQPLTRELVARAIRRYDDAGAQFVRTVAAKAAQRIRGGTGTARTARLVQRCVDTFLNSTLTSLTSRRYAAATLALTGLTDDVLAQITIISNIQEARRETGIPARESEQFLLRQVKRPNANPDIDFQVYALKEAVESLPEEALTPARRMSLADRLADLGVRSDGWTAAAATSALLRIGAVHQAIDVVTRIDRRDPSRSEGVINLVRGLLALGEERDADTEAKKGLSWAQSLPERHPERITAWGLANVYLDYGKPHKALEILEQRRQPGWQQRLRKMFNNAPTEEELREEGLRMRAATLMGEGSRDTAAYHLERILRWAPQILEGKALALFYTDSVLAPLLEGEHDALAWQVLPGLQQALVQIGGREHPDRIAAVADMLARRIFELRAQGAPAGQPTTHGAEDRLHDNSDPAASAGDSSTALGAAITAANDFLIHLWEAEAKQGIWSTVHGVGGSLPLVLAVAGPVAVLQIAQAVSQEGRNWGTPVL